MLTKKWAERGEEPLLEDLMKDPIIGLVMARDNLDAKDVWAIVEKARFNLRRVELNAA